MGFTIALVWGDRGLGVLFQRVLCERGAEGVSSRHHPGGSHVLVLIPGVDYFLTSVLFSDPHGQPAQVVSVPSMC